MSFCAKQYTEKPLCSVFKHGGKCVQIFITNGVLIKKGGAILSNSAARMISNLSVSVPFQRGRDTAVYCNGKIGDDYIWVILHVVLDPVQHKPHKSIFIGQYRTEK